MKRANTVITTGERGFAIEIMPDDDGVNGRVILIRPAGTGDYASADHCGFPVVVEIVDGKPLLFVWADINQEDSTHRIDLSGALESQRRTEKEDEI